ncbi:GGDEF domain-containing protein [Thalassomonas actiniarum]|uniref:diguanylate cyclase n=1 Tax=Thalassomonas actiniarum TaxID=485447 RepID=A0AAE9YPF1_9GAMM|nr:GGDEF domain-containing protein [Thalassomonas actiniarum]WDD97829.1 GGDEF domain-containing protein [Thalassomonas actiniarum]
MKKAKQLTRLARSLILSFSFMCSLLAFGQVFASDQPQPSPADSFAGKTLPLNIVNAEQVQYQSGGFDSDKNASEKVLNRLPGEAAILTLVFITALLLALWYRWRIKSLYSHAQLLARLVQERTQALKQANLKLEKLACVDALTNTCNRRQFIVQAEKEFERFYRSQHHFSVLRAEIDNFHGINEDYGFACGDYVLAEVARVLKQRLRCGDILARWAGKEFIILLPETGLEGGEIVGKKICQAILAADFCYQSKPIAITLSLGAVQIELGESLDTCVQRADKALSQACEHGGGQVIALSAVAQVQSRKKICHHYG